MDQVKIGKFIAMLRKEQNMTQLELATKLGVTDRAISKWENGRGLPELSLIKPLSEALSVSINELLCGERIEEADAKQKSEEMIISTLDYSRESIKSAKKIFVSILGCILLLITVLIILFALDVNRMRNNQPVIFSTWGFSYVPPIDLHEEEVDLAIINYLVARGDAEPKQHEEEKTFAVMRKFLIEETKAGTDYNVYAWVLEEKYYEEAGEIQQDSGSSIPYKFVVEKQGEEYVVVDTQIPRDGSYYSVDMKDIFPATVRRDMEEVHSDGTIERLQMEIEQQVELWFHK